MKAKRKDVKEIGTAWVSIGEDNSMIGISWYRDHLQDNVKRIPVSLLPSKQWREIQRRLKK
ncbi:hypothetical protein LCGC14_1035880 [marine sediment metagenome]|uniref:Uncharacterized protein n=1 Tax=marine sediment metagenome TaxID=412755 RepID=A0A0F9QZA8_9ZZZZ